MALMHCPECNQQVSSNAQGCPKCGFPIAEFLRRQAEQQQRQKAQAAAAAKKKRRTLGILAIMGLFGACCLFGMVMDACDERAQEKEAEEERIAEQERIDELRENLPEYLEDVDEMLEEGNLAGADSMLFDLEQVEGERQDVQDRRAAYVEQYREQQLPLVDSALEEGDRQQAQSLLEELERWDAEHEEVQQRREKYTDLDREYIAESRLQSARERLESGRENLEAEAWLDADDAISRGLGELDEVHEDYLTDDHAALRRELEQVLATVEPHAEAEREEMAEEEARRSFCGTTPNQCRKWQVRTEQSEMDNFTNVYLTLESENAVRDWLGSAHRGVLIVQCVENNTRALVRTGMSANPELGNYDKAHARVRLDDEAAERVNMSESTSGDALFFPGATNFPRKFRGHERLRFEFTPFESSSKIFDFDLAGYDEVLPQLQEACGWN